jgi:hypothetical protein
MKTDIEKVQKLAKNLRTGYPRSPREKLGGYVIAARCVDKCRAFLLGMNGEYNYWPCSLASQWFSFTGITPEQLKDVVARREPLTKKSPNGSRAPQRLPTRM